MNLLLFKLRYLGDVLMTTPAIRLLRQSLPGARITMVVNQGTEVVLAHNPHLDQVLTVDKRRKLRNFARLVRALAGRRFDASVDFASGDRAAWLALLGGARARVSLASAEGYRRWLNNRPVPWRAKAHTVELYLDAAREALGILGVPAAATASDLEMPVSRAEEAKAVEVLEALAMEPGRFIVAHTACRYAENRWPQEHWVRLLDALGLPVVLVGAAADEASNQELIARLAVPARSVAGRVTLLECAALMRQAHGFIGHDSGPMHVAAAMGIPVAGFFGPQSHPEAWHPWTPRHRVISTAAEAAQALAEIRPLFAPTAGRT